jgi:hypothetical protein
MNLKDAYELVNPFFTMKEGQILSLFQDLSPKSIRVIGLDTDHHSVFIPGERDDRVLLVAHVDTVWHDSHKLKVGFNEEHALFFSATRVKGVGKKYGKPYVKGLGIGADDRAGVAAVWALRDLGHSLLLVNGEEHGCLGSYNLMSNPEMAKVMQDHQFAMQFDRNGRDDLVFYNVGTNHFEKWMQRNMPGFSRNHGSFTDICVLCEKICGVNVSIGYRNEHTPNEVLNLRYFVNTVETAKNLLEKSKLPRFELL